ncbi:DUF1259 domain-containing protein [Paenibacillus sp. VMFN-D1]|uniref:DUF1259 domain-containing protein n=1 Tax=Paenibacillus sp. VMFN-D1 TaxID=2135608 RepID=UPI000E230ECD|nr:DUF1259 domain-containing protein [Paenibacillus sp. VMFN-D1]RED41206.1 uncharacterized protein DUF1259 [Paenibacillus sp. VMFN-D1]
MRIVLMIWMMVLAAVAAPAGAASAKPADVCKIEKSLFKSNVQQEGNVCNVHIKRSDLKVSLMGRHLSPELMDLALGATFEHTDPQGAKGVVTGEFALLEDEVNPVIDALRKGKINISAVHNHWMQQEPEVLYLHFQAEGDLASLSHTVYHAMEAVKHQGTVH